MQNSMEQKSFPSSPNWLMLFNALIRRVPRGTRPFAGRAIDVIIFYLYLGKAPRRNLFLEGATCKVVSPPSSPVIQVNRRVCRFGRYKNHRRPHPPPRGSQVSRHPTRVSSLTLAHPLLTQPRSPSPTAIRSSNRVTLRGSILGPWPARPMGSHDGVVAPHTKVGSNVTLNCTLTFSEIHQWNT